MFLRAQSSPPPALFLASILAPMLAGCLSSESTDACQGAERCACYPNATCDEGLKCLSDKCVRPQGDAGDARQVTEEPDDGAGARRDGEEPDAGRSSLSGASDLGTDEERGSESAGSGGVEVAPNEGREVDASAPAVEGSGSQATPSESATDTLPTDAEPTDVADDGSTVSDAIPTDVTDTGTDTLVPETNLGDLPPLPEREDTALDAPSPSSAAQPSCASGIEADAMCRVEVTCVDPSACLASFEWSWAEASGGAESLVLRDASGDGTVVFGDHVFDASTRRAFVWRWGSEALTYLGDSELSSGTAINHDATAAVGAARTCPTCDWEGVLWSAGADMPIPSELGLASDISDVTTVVGYQRVDGVLWGYVWDGAMATQAQTLALQKISGDGLYAGGVADGGPVVLFYADGTKSIPSTVGFRPDIVLGVNRDGTLVVGYGWDGTGDSMFRWYVDDRVDVIAPLAGFDNVVPFSIDAMGTVMVGVNRQTPLSAEVPVEDVQAFYWDESDGLRSFRDELATRGIELPDAMFLQGPHISADGSTVIGTGFLDGAAILWRVRLVP